MKKRIIHVSDLYEISEHLRDLGHVPLRQGASFECPHCDASGTVHQVAHQTIAGPVPGLAITGSIGRVRCGEEAVL